MEQGGVESVVLALSRNLVRAGHESIVVSRGGRLVETLERDGARHVAMDLKSKNPLTSFARAAALRRFLKSVASPETLVCAHSRVPAWLFVMANRSLGLPWITYAHGANSVSFYSAVMTRGDLVVAPSRFLADFLIENYGAKRGAGSLDRRIRVIPNSVDLDRFDPAAVDPSAIAKIRAEWRIEKGDHVTMSIGRITPLKGFDAVIRDFSGLVAKGPPPGFSRRRLVIVGAALDGKEGLLRELKALAANTCPRDSVVFAGGRTDIPECLSLADEVVSGNVVKPESFGLSVAEALAMEKPVRLLRKFGGAAEVLDSVASFHGGSTRDAVRSLYGSETMIGKTLAAYEEVLA